MGMVNITDTSILHIITEYCKQVGYNPPMYNPTAGNITIAGITDGQAQTVLDKCAAGTDAVIASYIAAKAADASKLAGVLIEGKMCSATGQDQAGLTAVFTAINNGLIASTNFTFQNGAVLIITPANVTAVVTAWTAFRNSFYV